MCCCSIATIIYLHTMIYAATATDIGSMGLYGAGIPKNLYIYIYHSNNKYKYRYIHTYIHIYVCIFLHWTLYIYIYIFYGSSRSVCWILDRAFQSQFTITVDCYELGVSQKRRRVDCYQRMYWSDRIGLNMVLKNRFNGGRMIYSIAWFPALLTEYFNSNWTFKVDFGEMIIS